MKIPRVYIYLKIKNLFLSFFMKSNLSNTKFSKFLTQMTKKKYIEYFGMCRTSLIVILEYLKEKKVKKNEIILCSYNLEEMVEIVKNYNFKVHLVDIDLENGLMNINNLKEKISDKTAAILYTNMFNDYQHAQDIKKICTENDILMIEDCAIYFGNYTIINNEKIYAGSVGDVSIFSFGIMKNICAIFGGSLLTSDKEIIDFAIKKKNDFPKFSNFLFLKKIFFFIILKIFLSRYIYNYFFFYVIKIAKTRKIQPLLELFYPAFKFKKKTYIPKNYYSKINNLSLNILENYIQDKDFDYETSTRKKNNKIYQKYFEKHDEVRTIKIKDFSYQNFLDYPIIVTRKIELVNFLLKKGLETRIHFYSNCEEDKKNIKNENANFVENNIICLPSHSQVSINKINEYCKSISEFYGSNN